MLPTARDGPGQSQEQGPQTRSLLWVSNPWAIIAASPRCTLRGSWNQEQNPDSNPNTPTGSCYEECWAIYSVWDCKRCFVIFGGLAPQMKPTKLPIPSWLFNYDSAESRNQIDMGQINRRSMQVLFLHSTWGPSQERGDPSQWWKQKASTYFEQTAINFWRNDKIMGSGLEAVNSFKCPRSYTEGSKTSTRVSVVSLFI